MDNTVYDILETRIRSEINKNIEKLGVRTQSISIDADEDLNIKIVLVSDDQEIEGLASTFKNVFARVLTYIIFAYYILRAHRKKGCSKIKQPFFLYLQLLVSIVVSCISLENLFNDVSADLTCISCCKVTIVSLF